jgi:hypothetical protein
MGPRGCLDDVEKRKFLTLLGLELRPLNRPAINQWLYRLCYRDSEIYNPTLFFNSLLAIRITLDRIS